MKYNHYEVTLMEPGGYILLREEVKFTAKAHLRDLCRNWATIKNAQYLVVKRGQQTACFEKQVVSEGQFRWKTTNDVVYGSADKLRQYFQNMRKL